MYDIPEFVSAVNQLQSIEKTLRDNSFLNYQQTTFSITKQLMLTIKQYHHFARFLVIPRMQFLRRPFHSTRLNASELHHAAEYSCHCASDLVGFKASELR